MAKFLVTIYNNKTKETEVEEVTDKLGSTDKVYGLIKSLSPEQTVTMIEEVNTKKSKKNNGR